MNPTQQRINQARWWALREAPFDGALAMNLVDVIGNPHGDTACTDGATIYWDEAFVAKLTDPELRFVLLHETAHCALGHFWRLPHDELGNMAGDYAINAALVKRSNKIQMPAGGLIADRFKDMAEEHIYAILKNEPPSEGKGGGGQSCGTFTQGKKAGTPEEKAKMKAKWERAVIQAVQMANAQKNGNIPSEYERVASAHVAPSRVDWRQETSDFMRQQMGHRNDWSRSSRRMAGQPVIYPRKQRDSAGLIVAARDTSGSVDEAQLALFNAALSHITAELGCETILIDADSKVHSVRRVAPGDVFPADAKGGGGTCFSNSFEVAEELVENGEQIAGFVYLTDLAGSHYEHIPSFPTLWICPNQEFTPPPFGRTIVLTC